MQLCWGLPSWGRILPFNSFFSIDEKIIGEALETIYWNDRSNVVIPCFLETKAQRPCLLTYSRYCLQVHWNLSIVDCFVKAETSYSSGGGKIRSRFRKNSNYACKCFILPYWVRSNIVLQLFFFKSHVLDLKIHKS